LRIRASTSPHRASQSRRSASERRARPCASRTATKSVSFRHPSLLFLVLTHITGDSDCRPGGSGHRPCPTGPANHFAPSRSSLPKRRCREWRSGRCPSAKLVPIVSNHRRAQPATPAEEISRETGWSGTFLQAWRVRRGDSDFPCEEFDGASVRDPPSVSNRGSSSVEFRSGENAIALSDAGVKPLKKAACHAPAYCRPRSTSEPSHIGSKDVGAGRTKITSQQDDFPTGDT
jgi:hypothetical protein